MHRALWSAAIVAIVAIGAGSPAASAATTLPAHAARSCTTAQVDYPPMPGPLAAGLAVTNAVLPPGTSSGSIELQGATPGAAYSGALYSSVIQLPTALASPAGVVRFTGLAVPASFAAPAVHHIDVVSSCERVGSFEVCITTAGRLGALDRCSDRAATSAARAGHLPHTGWDHLVDALRIALLAFALGALALYLRRRRRSATAPA
jgi:LPXTG-motif cell wall-anchored protein